MTASFCATAPPVPRPGARRLAGELTEDEFKPLRLMNGLYLQLHAYMLRIAMPYGVLSATQLRQLAYIARHYDRGYGHFTTRQNIQFNWLGWRTRRTCWPTWPRSDMHAIQTSGNCIRNVTDRSVRRRRRRRDRRSAPLCRDHPAMVDLHPEFTYLPRKFKIAIIGRRQDRAAVRVHDIGLRPVRNADGEPGFEVYRRRRARAHALSSAKPPRLRCRARELLAYLEAILRVYNALGRRDNIYKARIKILVREPGAPRQFIADGRGRMRRDPARSLRAAG